MLRFPLLLAPSHVVTPLTFACYWDLGKADATSLRLSTRAQHADTYADAQADFARFVGTEERQSQWEASPTD